MLDTEAAETLMSLSAPDERRYRSPLYADEMPWQQSAHAHAHAHPTTAAFSVGETLATSLPNASLLVDAERMEDVVALSLLHHGIDLQSRPLTDLIPGMDQDLDQDDDDRAENDDDSDVDMDDMDDMGDNKHGFRYQYSSFDGLVAAADHEAAHGTKPASQPISIPFRGADAASASAARRMEQMKTHKWSLSRVKEDASGIGRDSSPTGVEDDSAWFEQYRHTDEYQRRARLASICSSEGSTSDYGGLGRKHLEEFIRMEISNDHDAGRGSGCSSTPPTSDHSGKCIGSYSPEARRRRIERFLEKRKHRVWAKKVDYDVRKNFANSRLRVKGRFVKKEDEELLCELLSFM